MTRELKLLKQTMDEAEEKIDGLEGADKMRAMLTYNSAKHIYQTQLRVQRNNRTTREYKLK